MARETVGPIKSGHSFFGGYAHHLLNQSLFLSMPRPFIQVPIHPSNHLSIHFILFYSK